VHTAADVLGEGFYCFNAINLPFNTLQGGPESIAIMVEINGISEMEDAVSMSNSHLGKRKRTTSPEPAIAPKNTKSFPLQAVLKDTLLLIRRYGTSFKLALHATNLSQ
jgi:hypothetical protein